MISAMLPTGVTSVVALPRAVRTGTTIGPALQLAPGTRGVVALLRVYLSAAPATLLLQLSSVGPTTNPGQRIIAQIGATAYLLGGTASIAAGPLVSAPWLGTTAAVNRATNVGDSCLARVVHSGGGAPWEYEVLLVELPSRRR